MHNLIAVYTVSQKNCAKLILSQLCQLLTNFKNLWQQDREKAKSM